MDGAVQRVPREVKRVLLERVGNRGHGGRTQGDGDDAGNLWASMPSDHFVAACMTAMIMAEFGPVAAAVGWADVAIVGFAVVYLGEHYVGGLQVGSVRAAPPPPHGPARLAPAPRRRAALCYCSPSRAMRLRKAADPPACIRRGLVRSPESDSRYPNHCGSVYLLPVQPSY